MVRIHRASKQCLEDFAAILHGGFCSCQKKQTPAPYYFENPTSISTEIFSHELPISIKHLPTSEKGRVMEELTRVHVLPSVYILPCIIATLKVFAKHFPKKTRQKTLEQAKVAGWYFKFNCWACEDLKVTETNTQSTSFWFWHNVSVHWGAYIRVLSEKATLRTIELVLR